MKLVDQTGYTFQTEQPVQRIISLVPSQTELLFSLGLNDQVVGITKFCVHPDDWFRNKPRIGGTKNIRLDKVRELNPDLIIANKEENNKEDIELLRKEFPVYTSDIINLKSVIEMIAQIGKLTDTSKRATNLIDEIQLGISSIDSTEKYSCLYAIWNNPIMVAGDETFINEMLRISGFQNMTAQGSRYPEMSLEEIEKLNPDVLLLSSEPFPFSQKHMLEFKRHLKNTQILLVDGEMFSWYGSRLLLAPSYINQLKSKLRS